MDNDLGQFKRDGRISVVDENFAGLRLDALANSVGLQHVNADILKLIVVFLAYVEDHAGNFVDEPVLGDQAADGAGAELVNEILVSATALGRDPEVEQPAKPAENEAEEEDRGDNCNEAHAAGADGGQFLVRAEAPEHQEHSGEHSERE